MIEGVRAAGVVEAGRFYLGRGYRVVPVPARRKRPVLTAWQDLRIEEHELGEYFADSSANVGLLLGEPSGWLIDVDLDCREAMELADEFLPPTPAVTGRGSKPASHRWYIAPGAETRQFRDPVSNKMIVELRSTGGQTLVGPSTHPSGEVYGTLDSPPALAEAVPLMTAVRALAEAVLARRYPGGLPNPRPRGRGTGPTANAAPGESGPESGGRPRSTERDDATVVTRATAYLDAMPAAISGQGGHARTYTAACALVHGFGLDPESAFGLLRDRYNPRCEPPWTDKELRHKIDDAASKPHDLPYRWLRDAPKPRPGGDQVAHLPSSGHNASPTPVTVTAEPRRLALTDLGNAERLVARFGDRLRYCHATARWLVWDGRRWAPDSDGAPWRLAGNSARAFLRETVAILDDGFREKAVKFAIGSESRARIESAVKLAQCQPSVVVTADRLDADPWLLNVLNGTIDLRTGELGPHRREDLITKLAPVEFDPGADRDLFKKFLNRVFGGDGELIGYVMRLLGMALTGDIREQRLPIFHGSGANGKSVLLDTVKFIVGEYGGDAPPHLLTSRGRDEHPTEIVDLMGKRLVVASETEQGAVLKLQQVKRLTGDATLKGRYMRADYVEFPRSHKLIMVTNNKPRVAEDSEAVWRRIHLVPFELVIPPSERDPLLIDKLKEEAPGILAELVRGCLEWQHIGLGEPGAVARATGSYREAQDSIGRFLEECCVAELAVPPAESNMFTPWSALLEAYQQWCERNRETALKSPTFGESLDKRGYPTGLRRCSGTPQKGRPGLGLRSTGRQEVFDHASGVTA